MRSRLLSIGLGLFFKAYLWVAGVVDAWRYPPWEQPYRGFEWYCTASGWTKQEILNRGHCCHSGPCPMDVRKAG